MLTDQIKIFLARVFTYIDVKESVVSLKYGPLVLFVFFLLLLFIFISQRKKVRVIKGQSEIMAGIINNLQPGKGLEGNLFSLLDLVIPLVQADFYCFYLHDDKNNSYMLKAVRYRDTGPGQIMPSYSGLVPYNKEYYNPPVGIPAQSQPSKPSVIKEGKVPILALPIGGGSGLVRIGPVHEIPGETFKIMEYLCEKLQPVLEMLVEIEKMKGQIKTISASSEAIRSLSKSVLDLDGSLSTIVGLTVKMIDADGGCFLVEKENRIEAVVVMGLEKEAQEAFAQDQEAHRQLFKIADGDEFIMISRGMKDFINIPTLFAASDLDALLLLKVSGRTVNGITVFWCRKTLSIEQHRYSAAKMLVKRLGDVMDRQLQFKELSHSYLDTLKTLVNTVDNLEPYSISHSELVSRYTGIIAREMKLSDMEIKNIMLAGILHDLGMLGLSGDIVFKEGRYFDLEYEAMKLHAEVGASIIESTMANRELALYVRHHHERWDGYGYPDGLKGEEIPLGARIIAVADMFNAKLSGRKYREPASFMRALTELMSVSGTQLDPGAVDALISWFRKKQTDHTRRGHSLGPCWEMRCCPPFIAGSCPAYKETGKNCWEIEGVNCAAHGNKCATCMVYTEFIYRSEKKLFTGERV